MEDEKPEIHVILEKVVAAVPDLAAISESDVESALSDEVFPNLKMKKVVVDSIVEEVREHPSEVGHNQFARRLSFRVTGTLLREKDPEMMSALTPQLRLTTELSRMKRLLPQEEQGKLDWCLEQMTAPKTASPVRSYINYILKTFGSETATLLSDYSGEVREALFLQDESTSRETIRRRSLQRANSFVHLAPVEMPSLSIETLGTLDFDIFAFGEVTGFTNTLSAISSLIFEQEGILEDLSIPEASFSEFVKQIGRGYLKNPYHNALHAADVLQTCFAYTELARLSISADFDSIDKGALFISSIIHDYKHPGYNNAFLERTSHKIAVRYNDISCLENYHLAQAFKLAASPACNIFQSMEADVRRSLRKFIVHCVLGTDMAKHNIHGSDVASKLGNPDEFPSLKLMILGLVIHAGDISNPTKPYAICEKWAVRVSDEFFLQGDKERELGLPLTFQFDRHSINLANMQMGFIKGVVLPYFSPLASAFPGLEVCLQNLKANERRWSERVEEFAKTRTTA